MPATLPHAEHVGGLLRPPELLEARQARERGELSAEDPAKLEDDAALAARPLPLLCGPPGTTKVATTARRPGTFAGPGERTAPTTLGRTRPDRPGQ
ncbi:hypothetical protein FE391_19275 [Nonomuraea sp. KC401]|uniref:hypothetical protein n=1 Tax=unclassified Nonomuraea TaxID=2593643 RepID=UPI0010FCFCD6|nr:MULTISPECIES: hypothetical protein [unclassified Nonomuraea]NBE98031.1 hypothetical protein [Nonomuraea sp. K271]TLF71463.1 hypothetical protein FE391_19275 [Nonomuraea sp. KC401]